MDRNKIVRYDIEKCGNAKGEEFHAAENLGTEDS